jgi:hypothetical protein
MMLSLLIVMLFLSWSSAQNPRDIAEKSANAIHLESMEMVATLKLYDNKGNVRERKVANATGKFNGVTKTMVKFLSPADVNGTVLLIYDYEAKDDDMWIYMPALRNTRRIVSGEKGKSFMGSEFSNADMSKPNLDEYTYKLLDSKKVNGVECWAVESACKTEAIEESNGFSKKIAYIEKGNYLAQQIDYYDFNGKLFKTMLIGDYRKQLNGGYFAFKMEAKNHESNRRSDMVVEQFQLGSKLGEESFSTVKLGK